MDEVLTDIDNVLAAVVDRKEDTPAHDGVISHYLSKRNISMDKTLIKRICKFLHKEGYFNEHNDYQYTATLKGYILHIRGGYSAMVARETPVKEKKYLYENIVFWGAILAGLYAIVEIIKSALEMWFKYQIYNPF